MLKQFKSYSNRAYRGVMNHPKTSTVVMLGSGAAAALVWAARRNGGFTALYKQIRARVTR